MRSNFANRIARAKRLFAHHNRNSADNEGRELLDDLFVEAQADSLLDDLYEQGPIVDDDQRTLEELLTLHDSGSKCPVCGSVIDYCLGHGESGDPHGHATLIEHDNDLHYNCHPDGCEEAVGL